MPGRVRLTVPSDERALPILSAVATQFATAVGLDPDETAVLDSVTAELTRFILVEAYPSDPDGEVQTTLEAEDGGVRITIQDWGEPIARFGGGAVRSAPEALAQADSLTDDLRLVNLGGDGKRTTALVPVARLTAARASGPAFGLHTPEAPPHAVAQAEDIEVRPVDPAEIAAVSRLLYSNYGLSYGHPDFYRPEWLAGEVAAGRVLSTVAVHDGEVVGHHALLREAGETAAETGIAVVHPAYRGLGVFGRVFGHTIERAEGLGLSAVYGRAVTVHPFSQRAERDRGYEPTALLLGAVPARMSMRDIGSSADPGRRSATLVAFRPLSAPAARAVSVPDRYADVVHDAYTRLGLKTVRGAPAAHGPGDGPYVVSADDAGRATGVVLVRRWGEGAARDLLHEVRELSRRHEDVLYADLDLHALDTAALDEALELLHTRDFFFAGLMPYGPEGHDRLRLQRIEASNVELEAIVLDSEAARRLGAAVMADRALVEDD